MPGFDEAHVLGLAALASSEGGQDPLDAAIRMRPEIDGFLRQDTASGFSIAESLARLHAIAANL